MLHCAARPLPDGGWLQDPVLLDRLEEAEGETTKHCRPAGRRTDAHRTLALRDVVASNRQVAMRALLHRLITDFFLPHSTRSCLEAQVREVYLSAQAEKRCDSISAKAIHALAAGDGRIRRLVLVREGRRVQNTGRVRCSKLKRQ